MRLEQIMKWTIDVWDTVDLVFISIDGLDTLPETEALARDISAQRTTTCNVKQNGSLISSWQNGTVID